MTDQNEPTKRSAFLSTVEPFGERASLMANLLRDKGFTVEFSPVPPPRGSVPGNLDDDPRWATWYSRGLPEVVSAAEFFIAIETPGFELSAQMAIEFDVAYRRQHREIEPVIALWKLGEDPLPRGFAIY